MTINPNPTVSVPAGPIAPAGYELRTVDPHALLDNPYNARRAHRDREGLAPSIGALGILLPPLGSTDPRREAGDHRRRAPQVLGHQGGGVAASEAASAAGEQRDLTMEQLVALADSTPTPRPSTG